MALPLAYGVASALKPFTRSATYSTTLNISENGTEERWANRRCLMEFDLPYSQLRKVDKDLFKNSYASAKGQFDDTLSLTIGTTTYSHLALMDDAFTTTEKNALQYGVTVKLIQTQPQTVTAATFGGTPTFPSLANGSPTQLPFSQGFHYYTDKQDSPGGPRYAFANFGAGLTGFPTRGLGYWTVGGPLLTDADADTLEQMFHYCMGRKGSFSFTDPEDGTVYTKVRFDSDRFERKYVSWDQNAVTIQLTEFN